MNQWQPGKTFEEQLKTLLVPPRLYIKNKLRRELKYGEKEIALIPYLIDKNKVCLDVGANVGVYSELMSRYCEKVHAFEPNPKIYSILQRCSSQNVECHQIALSDSDGRSELRIPRTKKGHSNQGSSLSKVKVPDNYDAIEVSTVRLDSLNLGTIGFIKIDVEGFELSVLDGAKNTLDRYRPTLLIELEERHTGQPLEKLVKTVELFGYRCLFLGEGRLTGFETMDIERYHRQPEKPEEYVFNFIFLPTDKCKVNN